MNVNAPTTLLPPVPGTRIHGPKVKAPRRDTERPRRAVIVIGVVAAVWGLSAGSGSLRSLGMSIAFIALVVAAATSVARDRRAQILLAAAASLLPWLAIRHSPWLTSVNLVVAAALVLTAATVRPGEPIASRFGDLVNRWFGAAAASRFGAVIVGSEISAATAGLPVRRDQVAAVLRAAAVALGVCLAVVVLLASGDALFASYLNVGALSASVFNRIFLAMVGAACCATLFGAFRSLEPRPVRFRSARPTTVLVTMCGLSATIAAYGLVQVIAVASGAQYVEARTGLTYAEYARGGFFQLVAVTVLTVLVLHAGRSVRANAATHTRMLLSLAGVLTVGVISLVATSVIKLVIYADQFGLTMLRIYTITFAVWLGLVAVCTCVAVVRMSDRWLAPVVLLTVVVGAFAMNVANPERLVAAHNLERARRGAELDVDYLTRLSVDALPTILAGFDEFEVRLDSSSRWCEPIDADRGVFGANAAVSTASRAQQRFCAGS